VDEPVENTFSLKFLHSFSKGDALSNQVNLMMSENTPLVVEYKIEEIGHLKFYLAPKLQED
jgi:proliferating cell nuclear antigen